MFQVILCCWALLNASASSVKASASWMLFIGGDLSLICSLHCACPYLGQYFFKLTIWRCLIILWLIMIIKQLINKKLWKLHTYFSIINCCPIIPEISKASVLPNLGERSRWWSLWGIFTSHIYQTVTYSTNLSIIQCLNEGFLLPINLIIWQILEYRKYATTIKTKNRLRDIACIIALERLQCLISV